MSQADYQAWLASSSLDEPPAVAGARVFAQYSCNTCHGVQAPTLANLYGSKVRLEDGSTVIADDDYIRESIVAPRAKIVAGYPPIMPTFKGQLSEEQIIDLIAYIKTLGNGIPNGGDLVGGFTPPRSAAKPLSDENYVTQTPMPNIRNLIPTSGPAANNAPSIAPQPPGVKNDPMPTLQH
jgi:mono/diheme cytochrome c family protein